MNQLIRFLKRGGTFITETSTRVIQGRIIQGRAKVVAYLPLSAIRSFEFDRGTISSKELEKKVYEALRPFVEPESSDYTGKILVHREGKGFVAEPDPCIGTPIVGRGKTWKEALGDFYLQRMYNEIEVLSHNNRPMRFKEPKL